MAHVDFVLFSYFAEETKIFHFWQKPKMKLQQVFMLLLYALKAKNK